MRAFRYSTPLIWLRSSWRCLRTRRRAVRSWSRTTATPGGYGWSELAAIAAERLGRKVRLVGGAAWAVSLAAWLAERMADLQGRPPLLSRGKVAELYHRDWVSDTRAMAAVPGWQPQIRFGDGLAATLAWYRAAGWL